MTTQNRPIFVISRVKHNTEINVNYTDTDDILGYANMKAWHLGMRFTHIEHAIQWLTRNEFVFATFEVNENGLADFLVTCNISNVYSKAIKEIIKAIQKWV